MAHGVKYNFKRRLFDRFDKDNPIIWEQFRQWSLMACNRGIKQLSAWLIINRIRWERMVNQGTDDISVANDHIAFYARKFMEEDPETRGGFFAIKRMIDEDIELTKRMCGIK